MTRCFWRPFALVALGFTAIAVFSGCTTPSDGQALPTPSSAASAPSADPFANLNPCDVLNKSLEGQGFPPAQPSEYKTINGCNTKNDQLGIIGLTFDSKQGIDRFNGIDPSKLHAGQVNGRPAVQIRDGLGGNGSCDIALQVSKSARAVVMSDDVNASTNAVCEFAQTIAQKLEPQLPKL